MSSAEVNDLVIVGGGAAGLAAGIYAARARMKAVIFEGLLPGGQTALTDDIENYPGFEEGISGPELMMKFRAQAERFGLEFRDGMVTAIERAELDGKPGFKLTCEYGGDCFAYSVVLATGASHRHLNVPGEREFAGRGVSYCATCDGAFFRDVPIAVVGGGDSALDEGLFLTRFASKLYIIHRRDELRATKILQERAFTNEKVEIVFDSVVRSIEGNQRGVTHLVLENVKTKQTSELPVEGVFVFIGLDPVSDLVKNLVELNETDHVVVDSHCQTSISGLYAVGDLRVGSYRQVGTAVGDGITAAIDAEKYVEALKHG